MYNKKIIEHIYGNYEKIVTGFLKNNKREEIEDAISRFATRLLKREYLVEYPVAFTYESLKKELLNSSRTKISKNTKPISSFNRESRKTILRSHYYEPIQALEEAMDREISLGFAYDEVAKLPPGQKNAVLQFMIHNGYEAFKTNTEKAHFNIAIKKLKLALNPEFRLAVQKKAIAKAMEEISASF